MLTTAAEDVVGGFEKGNLDGRWERQETCCCCSIIRLPRTITGAAADNDAGAGLGRKTQRAVDREESDGRVSDAGDGVGGSERVGGCE